MTDTIPGLLPIDAPPAAPTADGILLPGGPAASKQLLDQLRAHYAKPGEPLPGGVFLTEVQAPGRGTLRRADAVWIGFTSNPGPCIDVCELKISPEDYRRELADPTKADAWWPYCTRFWIVSPSPAITPPDRLPPGWGLMCPKNPGRRFRVHQEPAVREPLVDLELLMAIAKKMDTARADEVRAGLRQAQEAAWRQHEQQMRDTPRLTPDAKRRLELLDETETALGLTLELWSGRGGATPQEFAEAFRRALGETQRDARIQHRVERVTNAARHRVEDLRRELRAAQAIVAEFEAAAAGEIR
jgi:AraC-like DNA-binding protein